MNNLRGSLISHTKAEEVASDDVQYVQTPWGRIKKRRCSTKCCICLERIWVEEREGCTWTRDTFLVVDPRAYVGGTPDYIKNSHVLLTVHEKACQAELNKRLNAGEFIDKPA